MTFEQSFQKYLLLSEANGTTNNLSTEKGKYAEMYNIAQNKTIEWLIEANASDENRYLQQIKEVEKELALESTTNTYSNHLLPYDYFDFLDLAVKATQDSCERNFTTREVKGSNVNANYNDPFSDPSFKYTDTFYTISKDAVQVYRRGFDISQVRISYYKTPIQVALSDPDDPESNFIAGEHQFDDKMINRIIFSTVALHNLSADDPKYQAFKQETIQKF